MNNAINLKKFYMLVLQTSSKANVITDVDETDDKVSAKDRDALATYLQLHQRSHSANPRKESYRFPISSCFYNRRPRLEARKADSP